ncbi:MAG: iron ABC transporter permease [Candidatus Verstraetearchaeota archaeon]|nr:iron ABC transporter permease [Candidatus Verstraetearchaeota archaeon]
MKNLSHKKQLILLLLIIFTIFLIPISIWLGYYKISIIDIIRIIFMPDGSPISTIIWDLRFRRILAAIIIGAILGGAGTAIQATMRNPLASPFTFGLSFAASLGVAIALLILQGGLIQRYQIYVYNPFIIAICAFIFSLIQVLIILLLAYKAGLSAGSLVLSAIAISFAYQAILYLLQYFYLNEILVSTVVFWTFGDLGRISWEELKLVSIVSIVLIIPYFIYKSIDYDLILGGDELAKSSGISPERLRIETTIIAALGTALATSFVGVIGFVCLVAPHIARLLVGGGHRYLMPTSMIMGSIILMLSDTIGRTIISPTIIPVGIMTSLLGVPILVYLLIKSGRYGYRD